MPPLTSAVAWLHWLGMLAHWLTERKATTVSACIFATGTRIETLGGAEAAWLPFVLCTVWLHAPRWQQQLPAAVVEAAPPNWPCALFWPPHAPAATPTTVTAAATSTGSVQPRSSMPAGRAVEGLQAGPEGFQDPLRGAGPHGGLLQAQLGCARF